MTHFRGPDGQEDMPYLLTPGLVTTSRAVKFAMLADWSGRDHEFTLLLKNLNTDLKKLASCDERYECVILQGPSANGIEAALGSFTPAKRKKTLIVSNGDTGQRALRVVQRIGRSHVLLDCDEHVPIRPQEVAQALERDRNITHVWVVQCETATGIVNPVHEIAAEIKSRGRVVMVDAVAGFGVLPLHMSDSNIDVVVSCPNRCLESVPGFSFILAKRELLEAAKGECHSLVLDLFENWDHFEKLGHLRFTPPSHALVALQQALNELHSEGGVEGRLRRYQQTAEALITRLKAFGFVPLLATHATNPFLQTILAPRDPNYQFQEFSDRMRKNGFVIHPGKLLERESFRIGTAGQINEAVIMQLMKTIETVMQDMGVRNFAPART